MGKWEKRVEERGADEVMLSIMRSRLGSAAGASDSWFTRPLTWRSR